MQVFMTLATLLSWISTTSSGPDLSASHSIPVWEVLDITFHANTDHPYNQTFGADLTGPESQKIRIPGFYNGYGQWVIRFSANQGGNWEFSTFSSTPQLSGHKGQIQVTENPDRNKHGAIVINRDKPRQFYYEDGEPYHTLAFECDWLFALDYGDTSLTKTNHLIDQVRANGFNQIVMNVYAYDVDWKKDPKLQEEHDFSRPRVFLFWGTNEKPDYSGLNVAFFQHFDRVMELLHEKNMVAHLMIYVWNKRVNWPEANSVADNRYFDYVLARYQAFPNIIWDVSKEALGYGHTDVHYISDRIDRIRRQDGYNRLVTVHDFDYCSRFPEKVDFISIQTWASDLYANMVRIRSEYPDKPVFNIEHGGYERSPYVVFEGDYTDPQVCLRRNYACMFAGTYSTYYWQGASWYVIVDEPFSRRVKPNPEWGYFKHMQDLMQRYSFDQLTPVAGCSSSGWCLSNGDGLHLIYVYGDNYAIHATTRKRGNEAGKISWFNTLTGEYRRQADQSWQSWQEFKAPWRDVDCILILE